MPDPTITVRGRGDFSKLDRDLARATGRLSSSAHKIGRVVGLGLGLAGVAVVKFGVDSVKSLARIERINTQTSAAIKSTGGAANVSAGHVEKLAGRLEDLTATEAETTQENENLLLTFTNIANRAGKGNAIFDRTTKIFVDMQRAIPAANMTQLGRALNDPIRGMAALTRVGVQFDDQQRKTITKLAESNHVMGAQKVILKELTKEFGGSGEAFAKTTEGKIELAKHQLGTFGETITAKLLPAIADLAVKGTAGLKKLTEHSDDIEDTARDLFGLGKNIAETVLPPAIQLGKTAVDLAGFLNGLPDPIKKIGIELGIAAYGFSKLNPLIQSSQTLVGGYSTKLRDAESRTKLLSSAARSAAGVGGLLALTDGLQKTDTAAGRLEVTLGAAATGFAAGGPWGALVGGVAAAAILKFKGSVDHASDSTEDAIGPLFDYADSLRKVDGAATGATRKIAAVALQQAGALPLAQKLGISWGDLSRAALGEEDALGRVTRVLERHSGVQSLTVDSMGNFRVTQGKLAKEASELSAILGVSTQHLDKETRAARELSITSGELGKRLKGVKDRSQIVSRIQMRGWPEAPGQVQKLIRGLNLTPKEKRIVFRALHIDQVERDAGRLGNNLKKVAKQPVDAETFTNSVKRMMSNGGGIVDRGGRDLRKGLRDGGKTKLDDQWLNDLKSSLSTGKQRASSGGHEVGASLKSGVLGGLSGLMQALSGEVSAAVNAAIAAGKHAADAHSPSRKMMKLGEDMADGLVLGLKKHDSTFEAAGQSAVGQILAGIDKGGADDLRDALQKIGDLVEKTFAKRFKNEKRANAETKKALKGLRDEERALKRNAKVREQIANKLQRAEEKLRDLQQQRASYADAVKQAALDFANITNLDTAFNADALAKALQHKLDKLRQFAAIIADLTARGLNATTLQQLIDAGVEGGLAEALALQQGGEGAIDQINQIQDQINDVAEQLGESTAATMYDAGIQAAEGLIKGLEARQKDLQRIARKLARDLVDEIKKELGIRSPSRIMRELGKQTGRGFGLGLDETHVKRVGQRFAGDFVTGFGKPELSPAAVTAGIGAGALGAGAPVRVQLTLTADQLSAVQRGRAIVLDIDAYTAAGGKPRA